MRDASGGVVSRGRLGSTSVGFGEPDIVNGMSIPGSFRELSEYTDGDVAPA